jgi:hypothetical protein
MRPDRAPVKPVPSTAPGWEVLPPSRRIGTYLVHPETRAFGELLIDLEEDKAARAVVFGLLAEMERKQL